MEEDDDFGDLYADMGVENPQSFTENLPNLNLKFDARVDEDDEEDVLYGKPSPKLHNSNLAVENHVKKEESNVVQTIDLNLKVSEEEVVEVKSEEPGPSNNEKSEQQHLSGIQFVTLDNKNLVPEKIQYQHGEQHLSLGNIESDVPNDSMFDFETSPNEDVISAPPQVAKSPVTYTTIPGLSPKEEDEGNGENFVEKLSSQQHFTSSQPPQQNFTLQDDDDSDSEDDLQILVNDNCNVYPDRMDQEHGYGVGSEDEDQDDLVIVAGGDQPLEEQEWAGESTAPFDAAISTSMDKSLVGERNGDEKGQAGKIGIVNCNAGVTRLGYSGSHYLSAYKYVRDGTVPNKGAPGSMASGANNGRAGGVWPPGKNGPPFGKGSTQRAAFPGNSGQPWNSVPGVHRFQNGFDISLPPNKTVYDIDIESLEEKPWKHPGIEIGDFFNFNFDEDSFKDYSKKLEQHRLEATMQRQIRVYEPGRSDQDYEPNLPTELQSSGLQAEAFGENSQNKSDPGNTRGRGPPRVRTQIPMGRAIQVEGGGVERRPSTDYRKPRMHDVDAVIEIIAPSYSDEENTDHSKAPENTVDANESVDSEREEFDTGYKKQESREPSFQVQNLEPWERDNDSRKNKLRGSAVSRIPHHGDGILPLPPGPPIQCPAGPIQGPGIFATRIPEHQHLGRRPQTTKSHKVMNQLGNNYNNGGIGKPDSRGVRHDSFQKGSVDHGMERIDALETGYEEADFDRVTSPDANGRIAEHSKYGTGHRESRSEESKRSCEVRTDKEDINDDHHSDQSVKRQKIAFHSESPVAGSGYSQANKSSKGASNKAESGNSRGYFKDRVSNRDYSKNRGEEEISQYRPQKQPSKERNKLHSDEEVHLSQKDHHWNSRHSSERDVRYQRGRENPNYFNKDDYLIHGDKEELHRRRSKERIDKYRERDEYARPWQGKVEEARVFREKGEDSKKRDVLGKEDAGQHRDRVREIERDDRHDNLRKRRDQDDSRAHNNKEDIKRKEKDDTVARPEKVDDAYSKRKRDEDLAWKDKATKEESFREIRGRDEPANEKYDKAEEYRRRKKEEELRRRDQNSRDTKEREETGKERSERDDGYQRKKEEDLRKKEKDQGIRDPRDREEMQKEKHEKDEELFRRKDEDLRRREKADKDETASDMREKDDIIREKPDKGDDYHLKRKEEELKRRTLHDDSQSRKQRDESWRRRDREDEHWRKSRPDENPNRREREEEKSLPANRGRHHSEEKAWYSDKDRVRGREESLLSGLEKERLKDRRKNEDLRGMAKDRLDDTSKLRHHDRGDIHLRADRSFHEERSTRSDRHHHRYDPPAGSHFGEDQKLHREKRAFEHRNGSQPSSGDERSRHDHAATGRKRKAEDYHVMHHVKKTFERGIEDQEPGGTRIGNLEHKSHSRLPPVDSSKKTPDQEVAKSKHGAPDDSASEDESHKRGRSKLERWASQKDREESNPWESRVGKSLKIASSNDHVQLPRKEEQANNESASIQPKNKSAKEHQARVQEGSISELDGKEVIAAGAGDSARMEVDQNGNKQHSDTVAKLEKRRERFKQPIANEKELKRTDNEPIVENDIGEVKPERPARKRRWGSN